MTYVDETREEEVTVRGDKIESEKLDSQRSVVFGLVRVVLEIGEFRSDELPTVPAQSDQTRICSRKRNKDSQSGNLRNDGDEEDSRKHDLSSNRFGQLQIDY